MALSLNDKLALLKSKAPGNYYASRTVSQIGYAIKISTVDGGKYDGDIEPVLDFLVDDINKNGAVTVRDEVDVSATALDAFDITHSLIPLLSRP